MKLKINPIGPEPITVPEMKDWLQEDRSENDMMISRLIKSARQYIETMCGISIIEKEIELELTKYDVPFQLPYGPVKSVEVLEIDGVAVDHTGGDYIYQAGRDLKVHYTTGFDPLPEGIEQLINDLVKIYYDGRGTAVELPLTFRSALSTYSRNII